MAAVQGSLAANPLVMAGFIDGGGDVAAMVGMRAQKVLALTGSRNTCISEIDKYMYPPRSKKPQKRSSRCPVLAQADGSCSDKSSKERQQVEGGRQENGAGNGRMEEAEAHKLHTEREEELEVIS
eukprot:755154-Hanusia_phi.AAC.3